MVGADLEGLVAAHDQSGLEVLLVLQKTDITGTTLLPLATGFNVHELEELGAHLEELFLRFFVGLGLDLLGQLHNRLEVDVLGLGSILLYRKYVNIKTLACLIFFQFNDSTYLAILGGLTLSLGAARVVATVFVVLLLLLRATTEHGKNGRRGDGLLLFKGK